MRSHANNIRDTNLDVSLRTNAKNGALAPAKVSKLPHLMGHKQQAKTSLKAPNRQKKRTGNQQMVVGGSESAGGLDSNEDGGIVFMTGEYAPTFDNNGGDASGRDPAIAGEETGANTRTALDQPNIQ